MIIFAFFWHHNITLTLTYNIEMDEMGRREEESLTYNIEMDEMGRRVSSKKVFNII